jgi:hypothetical protein
MYGSPTPVSYYGAPNPVSPSNDSYNSHYASPSGVSATDSHRNNHYASPVISPGYWNTPSPNNPSPTQYASGSPTNEAASPSSARSGPFVYSSTPQKLSLPRQLGAVEKSELDMGREKVASARALCLLQETFHRGAKPTTAAEHKPVSQSTDKPRIGPKKEYQPQRRFWTASKEKLATSTWKKKSITAEEDFENISDFKCQLDFDRQKYAQSKALKMLSDF